MLNLNSAELSTLFGARAPSFLFLVPRNLISSKPLKFQWVSSHELEEIKARIGPLRGLDVKLSCTLWGIVIVIVGFGVINCYLSAPR